jgi:enolase-phosphatase E1
VSYSLTAARAGAVLLDIEGTTTPVSFVYGVLFPYARQRVRIYLERASPSDSELNDVVARLREEHAADVTNGHAPPPWRDRPPDARLASIAAYIEWLMDRDRKSTPLKWIQGKIWEEGYRSGELKGEVFPDVGPALERWTAAGVGVGIFSSGSVLAQKLLFGHSSAGDLRRFLRWHFDTTVGSKVDAGSYRRIADAIAVPSSRIVFVSDVVKELDAAAEAGVQTVLCIRPPAEQPPGGQRYPSVRTFEEIVS